MRSIAFTVDNMRVVMNFENGAYILDIRTGDLEKCDDPASKFINTEGKQELGYCYDRDAIIDLGEDRLANCLSSVFSSLFKDRRRNRR